MVLTREEAAEALRVSVRQLDRLIAEGTIPAVRFGGSVRIRTADLETWLRGMSQPMTIREVSLFLSIEPADIQVLCDVAGLPSERLGGEARFYKPLLERWRAGVEPRDTI